MVTVLYYVVPTILALIAVRKYRESKWGTCKNKVKLKGKVAIVTGANSGIGFQIAKNLASRGAEVICACRNVEEALKCIRKIRDEISFCPKMIAMEVDLSSLKSIENFIEEVKSSYDKIDLLINNAGVSYPDKLKLKTDDGFEIHFGVNHLAHFHLTNSLLELLKKETGCSRVVIVSSTLHEKGRIYLQDLNLEKVNGKTNPYANSKLANVYFGQELAKRAQNSGINVYIVCPGWVYTNLFRHHERKWYTYVLVVPIALFFMRSAEMGAQTVLYCATEPDLENETGLIYRDCQKYTSKLDFDEDLGVKLWDASENLIKESKFNSNC